MTPIEREAVIAECAKIVDKTSQEFGQNSSSAIAIRKAAADIRTLASAPSEAVGRGEDDPDPDGNYVAPGRTFAEFHAQNGEPLLRKDDSWSPANDCGDMTVQQMIARIYSKRQGHAVAPNGHTCPFMTVEEWSRLADWAKTAIPTADRDAIREALKPFADLVGRIDLAGDDAWDALGVVVKNRDLRRAASALALLGEG
jgi:hypothetical protein